MRRGAWVALVIVGGAVPWASSSHGQDLMPASFDCGKARTWVEKTICRNPELADRDGRMAAAYRDLVEQAREGGGPDADLSNFQREQRAWLKARNRCRTTACIAEAYDRRINEVTVDYDE